MSRETPFDWDRLLESVVRGHVIPVIGPELLVIQHQGRVLLLYRYLAERLAEAFKIPPVDLPDEEPLNYVVGRCLEAGWDEEQLDRCIRETMKRTALVPGEPLRKLARIKSFNLFVSMTFDSLLAQALDEERFGGVTTANEIAYVPNGRPSQTDLPADRSSDRPLLHHLLGRMSPRIDYVITEEDTLEFFYALHEKEKRPVRLFDELRSHHLVIIGCSFPDWLARFFIRIARDGPLSARRQGSEFLADHRVQQTKRNLVLFLQLFSHRTEIFPGGAVEFVEELTSRIPSIRPAGDSLPVPKGTIFLSYASEERKAAENIRAGLENAKLNVWLDTGSLQGGDEFQRNIQQAIHEAALFVPIISSHTEGDSASFFRREWAYALDRVKDFTGSSLTFLLPVTIDETGLETAREVPREFKKCHWVNLPGGQATPEFPELVKGKVREYVKGEQGRRWSPGPNPRGHPGSTASIRGWGLIPSPKTCAPSSTGTTRRRRNCSGWSTARASPCSSANPASAKHRSFRPACSRDSAVQTSCRSTCAWIIL